MVTRILLADDHDVVRRGMQALLVEAHPEWQVCAEATNGREAVSLATRHKPDVVVLDLSMPGLNGLEATRQIRRDLPGTEVLIFTLHDGEQIVRDVLSAGARGYVVKSEDTLCLISAIEALARHKPYLASSAAEKVLGLLFTTGGEPAAEARNSSADVLSNREREVAQLLAEGKSNKQVADALFISVRTAETHRAAIMRKLGINSIVQLVHYALRNRLIEIA
jgi:DNA-binding NarL/FixJ family response regulator